MNYVSRHATRMGQYGQVEVNDKQINPRFTALLNIRAEEWLAWRAGRIPEPEWHKRKVDKEPTT